MQTFEAIRTPEFQLLQDGLLALLEQTTAGITLRTSMAPLDDNMRPQLDDETIALMDKARNVTLLLRKIQSHLKAAQANEIAYSIMQSIEKDGVAQIA